MQHEESTRSDAPEQFTQELTLPLEARIVAIGDAARRLGSSERPAPAGPVGHPGIPESILPSRSQT